MTDRCELFLEQVKVQARVGAYASERGGPQPLLVSLWLDVKRAKADALASVVSYEWVLERVREVAGGPHRELLETLGDALIDTLFADPRITKVKVSIHKVGLFPDVGSAGVVLERSRNKEP